MRACDAVRAAVPAVACLFLWACAAGPPAAPAAAVPAGSATRDFSGAPVIAFDRMILDLPRGTRIGSLRGGLLCAANKPLVWDFGTQKENPAPFANAFRAELAAAGFPVAGAEARLFETDPKPREDLVAGAVVKRLRADLCYPLSGYGDLRKQKGSGEIEVAWQVYSRRRRAVVFRAAGTGRGRLPEGSDGGVEGIAVDAFADATRNLLADPAFTAFLAAYAAEPVGEEAPIHVAAPPPLEGSAADHMGAVRRATLTVALRGGHGSAFVIDPAGWALTNAHVVGDANAVTVRTVTGHELAGEVVRVDPERDVALVKVERAGLTAVPLRATEPEVGEEVYAVGSPLSESLQTSVTRGVVSGYREERGQRYIQSDVSIQPGNSGGPLVDASGNVVGISVMGLFQGGVPVGLNFFIPIRDALDSLHVEAGKGFGE